MRKEYFRMQKDYFRMIGLRYSDREARTPTPRAFWLR